MAARYRYPNRRISDFARWAGARNPGELPPRLIDARNAADPCVVVAGQLCINMQAGSLLVDARCGPEAADTLVVL